MLLGVPVNCVAVHKMATMMRAVYRVLSMPAVQATVQVVGLISLGTLLVMAISWSDLPAIAARWREKFLPAKKLGYVCPMNDVQLTSPLCLLQVTTRHASSKYIRRAEAVLICDRMVHIHVTSDEKVGACNLVLTMAMCVCVGRRNG